MEDLDREYCDEVVNIVVDNMLKGVSEHILKSSPRYEYLSKRLTRVLSNAVWVISEHIKRSSFIPSGHEVAFGKTKCIHL